MTKTALTKTALTEADKQQYVKEGGSRCPYCGSHDLEGGDLHSEGSYISQTIDCLSCESKWDDIYQLSGVESID